MNNLPFARAQDKPDDQPTVNSQQPFGFAQDEPTAKISGHPEKESLSETHLEEVERALELTAEVKRAGVEHIREEIKLTPQARSVGIEEAAEIIPVSAPQTGVVNLPLTDDQIQKALHQKITESILWLANWCLRQLQLLHHKLKG